MTWPGARCLTVALATAAVWAAPTQSADAGAHDVSGIVVTGCQYRSGRWGLYKLGTTKRELVSVVPGGLCPRYSPDRQHMAFTRGGLVWIRDVASGANRPCPVAMHFCESADDLAWFAGSARLCFPLPVALIARGLLPRLFAVPGALFGTSRTEDVFASPEGPQDADCRFPAITTEGRLALCSTAELAGVGLTRSHVLVQLRPESEEYRRVTDWPDSRLELAPHWSPDGKLLAFDAIDTVARHRETFIYDTEQDALTLCSVVEEPRRPAFTLRDTWCYGWAPTGSRLLVGAGSLGLGDRQPASLYILANGGVTEVLAERCVGGDSVADAGWSPDGDRVAYVCYRMQGRPGYSPPEQAWIAVWDLGTGGETRVYEIDALAMVADPVHADPVLPTDIEW